MTAGGEGGRKESKETSQLVLLKRLIYLEPKMRSSNWCNVSGRSRQIKSQMVCAINVHTHVCTYIGTSLIWTQLGQIKVS